MGVLIDTDDFVGRYAIAQTSFTDLDAYINKYEEIYLSQLLGADLYALFKADLVIQVPATAIYKTIFNPFKIDEDACVIISEGIKQMAIGFVYWEYVRLQHILPTQNGAVINQVEVSSHADINYLYMIYNESIYTYQAIQWFINKNKTNYPEYNGQMKSISHFSL